MEIVNPKELTSTDDNLRHGGPSARDSALQRDGAKLEYDC